MHVVEGISDRVVALDHGVKIAEGTFEQVATDPRVVEAYLGTTAAVDEVSDAPLLELDGRRHLLRADPHPPGAEPARDARRARLPARRQRVRQVDDAEDDPRHRRSAQRVGAASTART